MYREDLKKLQGIDSYYYDDSEDEEQDNYNDCYDFEEDNEPDWQQALNNYEHSFERYS